MISLKEFHTDFLQSILSETESRGLLKPQAFFEEVCEDLISSGDLTNNYTFAEYTKRGMEVHGYDYDEERRILSLIVSQFFQEDEIQTLTKNQSDTKFNRLKIFFKKCYEGFYVDLEQTAPEYSMAYNIYNYCQNSEIDRLRLMIITDGKMTRNLTRIPSETDNDINTEFRIIDIEDIYKIRLSDHTNEFVVEADLPCLEIPSNSSDYESYLSVVSGEFLYEIYEKFGQKLFEQNVRTFLQFRGNVNKGLRNTIEYKPEMFFAYNNGITATATNIELDGFGNISKIHNFQIVNGGQTTSSIYAAKKKSKLNIENIAVQMKLSVVKNKEKQHDFVSKVSEFANTQNKVNKSDFFSNSPFHKEMKDYSGRIWVSALNGSQSRTHWFYERVRGEYLNEQAYLTDSKKKKFQLENPKHQLLDKTFLAKSENAWLQKPHIVSRGAQYNFSNFAEDVTRRLEKDNLSITEAFFKNAVSKVILFRAVEKLVSSSSWYDGGYRAQTVAYSVAYLSFLASKIEKFFNFSLIWEKQSLPEELVGILQAISEKIYESITHPPEGSANVTQWCKKALCWETVKSLELNVALPKEFLINKEEQKDTIREEKKNKKMDTGIEMQIFVVNVEPEIWIKLLSHYHKYKDTAIISPKQFSLLEKMTHGLLQPPSERQSKILYEIYIKAEEEGIINT